MYCFGFKMSAVKGPNDKVCLRARRKARSELFLLIASARGVSMLNGVFVTTIIGPPPIIRQENRKQRQCLRKTEMKHPAKAWYIQPEYTHGS